MSNAVSPIPSASVVLLRERDKALEVLLLKKNANITFGGNWVFPGGRIDQADIAQTSTMSYHSERNAATRECSEETGLTINANKLLPISRWITPVIRPKRFTTLFFLYNAGELTQNIQIDNGEIVDAKWAKVSEALEQHQTKNIVLAAPAFVTLSQVSEVGSLSKALNFFKQRGAVNHTPRVQVSHNGAISLYEGDDAYVLLGDETTSHEQALLQQIESVEHQHRLYMFKNAPWSYVNTSKIKHLI